MIFVTADEHYEHENVIRFCQRPFLNVDEMREEMILRHNARVKSGDNVYHIGDMFWRTCSEAQALEIMSRLNGNHYYINGNHEELMRKSRKLASRFVWVRDISKLHSTEISPRIVLFHYAMLVWEGSHRGDWQLYGHSHGELSKGVPDAGVVSRLNSFDIGVDCWDYYPVSLEEIAIKMKSKYVPVGVKPTLDSIVADMVEHICPLCKHKFNNFSKTRAVCSRCDSLVVMDMESKAV